MIILAERMQLLRKERKLTQKDVAAHLGITVRTYQYYEGDDHRPDLETIVALADFYNVTTDYLLGRTDQR